MSKFTTFLREMRFFLVLWATQALSGLASAMTAYALVVWSYQAEGSALSTALLSVCSYAPYVLMSVFAGALSDKWNKKATLLVWCVGSFLGWTVIPLMNANLGAILRERIPVALQGRVYAVRNSLQFFTIPLAYLCGGILVDHVCEPLMAAQSAGSLLTTLFGTGKGAGAALLFFVLAIAGNVITLVFRRNKHIRALDD